MESNITLKQCLYLLINTNLKYCEVWDYFQYWDYRITKSNSKFSIGRKSRVLIENGYSRESIYRNNLFGGDYINKKYNKYYKPEPIITGSIGNIINSKELLDKNVININFYGFLNKKVRILITEAAGCLQITKIADTVLEVLTQSDFGYVFELHDQCKVKTIQNEYIIGELFFIGENCLKIQTEVGEKTIIYSSIEEIEKEYS